MQDNESQTVPDRRAAAQRRWWLGGLVALGVLVVATVALLAAGGDDDADGAAAASSSPASTVVTSASTAGSDPTASTAPAPASTEVASSVPGSSAATGTTLEATSTTLVGSTGATQPTVPFVPGNGDTVPVQTVVTAPPVAIDDVADPGTGMSFRLERLEAVRGEANGPGEIAGPAVRVTVVASNDTGAPVLLETVVVDLVYGAEKSSAAPLSGPGAVRFTGELAPGASASGVYVFDVPLDQRGEVSVIVSYAAAVSPVVFTGPAPTE